MMKAAELEAKESKGIGQRNERSLHAGLKQWYALPGDKFEVPLDGFVIDLVRGSQLIEIQTRNFSAIRRKLQTLIKKHPVHLLHPITLEKWVVQTDTSGTPLSRRKSPFRGAFTDLFEELVRLPDLLLNENFTVEFLLIGEEEVRCKDGRGSKHRKRESLNDRRLLHVIRTERFNQPADFLRLLPLQLPQPFSNKCLAAAAGLPLFRCRQITYCLRKMNAITVAGKRGNEVLYNR